MHNSPIRTSIPDRMTSTQPSEEARLSALRAYDILDTGPEKSFDDLTSLASHICDTPIALISLVDSERQWFKSKVGLDLSETSRDIAFCSHAIEEPDLFVVRDAAQDERFASNPMVLSEPKIRFYAAVPVFTSDGQHALGTLCVIDREPRDLDANQQEALRALARQVQAQLELRLSLRREHELARIDPLTSVPNRRAFYEVLQRERHRLERNGRPLTLAYIDLDNFKEVNDGFGHKAGDSVLTAVASVMARSLRKADVVARLGGDEFAIMLPETNADAARQVVTKLHMRLMEAMKENGLPITFSIGSVTFTGALGTVEDLLQKADELMYAVKIHGKSNVRFEVVSEMSDQNPVELRRS